MNAAHTSVHGAEHGHGHSISNEQHNHMLKFGWWLYIASEVMIFSSLIAVFMLAKRLYPAEEEHLVLPLVAFNTFLLLTSSWMVVRGLVSIQRGDQVGLQRALMITVILGSIFLGIQIYEYNEFTHHGVTLTSSMYGSAFYIMTGFHGFHVFIGVLWALWAFFKALNGHYTAENNIGIELFGLYWHFVDVVWVVLFTLIYVM
ncbi:MAG: heme-copper oxidase subunit III [Anaerolineae bacterium]|nr:heme-copper oxidase subunit III [Anaerolineae bacterium]